MLKILKGYLLNKRTDNILFIGSVFVIFSSLFSSFFSYLFQVLMGRALSVNDYGVLVALFSIFSIISLPYGFISPAITKIVSEIKDIDYPKGLSYFFYSVFRINFFIAFLLSFLPYLFRKYIADYLKISDIDLFVPFFLYLFSTLVFAINMAFLQALKRFKALAVEYFSVSFAKFITAILALYFSFSIGGTFGILALLTLFAGLIGYKLLLKNIVFSHRKFSKSNLNRIATFSVASSFTFLGITFLFNNDVLLVKHLFDSQTAGFYSSAAVIGRIIFYGVSPISMVLFPECAERFFKKQDYLNPLIKGSAAVFFLSMLGFVIMYFFPTYVVKILFGDKYINAVEFLPLYALYMVSYTMVSVLGWLLVAISKLKEGALALGVAAIQYFSVKYYFNNSVSQVLWVSIILTSLLLMAYVGFIWREYVDSKKVKNSL